MDENEHKAAAGLVAGHLEAITSGAEADILREILPPEMYDQLVQEVNDLLDHLSADA